MIKQHCNGTGKDCNKSTINLLVADSDTWGWNEGCKGSLGVYSWHSVPPSRGENVVMVV